MKIEPIAEYAVNPRHYDLLKQREPFRIAFVETATIVGQWCRYIEYKLIAAAERGPQPLKEDFVRKEVSKRRAQIEKICDWVEKNSWKGTFDLFTFFMRTASGDANDEQSLKFDHHDDTCCWWLRLTTTEFAAVKAMILTKGLPEDLFVLRPERDHLRQGTSHAS